MASSYLSLFSRQASLANCRVNLAFNTSLRAKPVSLKTWSINASSLHSSPSIHVPKTHIHFQKKTLSFGWKAAGMATLGLGLSGITGQTVHCDPGDRKFTPQGAQSGASEPLPPPPKSEVNLYELSFGTVAGICAGVFVKKGAKALAFFFGGIFFLLQYLRSLSVIKVDWSRVGDRFENLFYSQRPDGTRRAPTVYSLWAWLVDFLTADFQWRASFVAGLALGLRLG